MCGIIGGIHAHGLAAVGGNGDVGGKVDGARQHKAVVVVGVFANQVDAAGCTHGEGGGVAELLGKDMG